MLVSDKMITKETLDHLLDDFTKAVAKKEYKRIPYSEWKILKGMKKDDVMHIHFDFDEHTVSLEEHSYLEYAINDGSFGTFLFNTFYSEENIMPPKDLDYSNGLTYVADKAVDYASASTKYDNELSGTKYVYNTATSTSGWSIYDQLQELQTHIVALDTKIDTKEDKRPIKNDNKKENEKMFKFDFGPCSNNTVKMSVYGMAVKNTSGSWVSYDVNTKSIVDVDILNFDGAKFLYKMPVPISDIKVGDVVIHNGHAMFVVAVPVGGVSISVIDPHVGERKDILLTKSPFGFDFATKVVNLLGGAMNKVADSANPFGNMWMFMLAGDNKDFADIAPLMLMSNGNTNIDPMMAYALMSGKGGSDILPLMLMMNANKNTCACSGNCHCADAKAE